MQVEDKLQLKAILLTAIRNGYMRTLMANDGVTRCYYFTKPPVKKKDD